MVIFNEHPNSSHNAEFRDVAKTPQTSNQVDTQRCFNVYKTFIRRLRYRVDIL